MKMVVAIGQNSLSFNLFFNLWTVELNLSKQSELLRIGVAFT